jgi:hypothetical protein
MTARPKYSDGVRAPLESKLPLVIVQLGPTYCMRGWLTSRASFQTWMAERPRPPETERSNGRISSRSAEPKNRNHHEQPAFGYVCSSEPNRCRDSGCRTADLVQKSDHHLGLAKGTDTLDEENEVGVLNKALQLKKGARRKLMSELGISAGAAQANQA